MNRIRRYFQREKGSAALYFAMVLTILFGMASVAIDSSNAYLQRRMMQNAADAAALAGARALAKGQDVAVIDSQIQALAAANGSTQTTWEFTADGRGVDVSTSNEFDTYFAGVLGVDQMDAHSASDAKYAPVVGMDKLVPLAINGCDCLEFESFPQAIGEDDFGEIVIGDYIIGNVQNVNIDYVLDLSGLDSAYSPTGANRPYYMFYDQGNNGVHVAYGDGTAHTVERVTNVNGDGFIVDLWFQNRTSTPPGGSPHCNGACPNTTDWYYYTVITGTLSGIPGTRYEGAVIDVSERVRAAQVGTNAHLENPASYLGATAWLALDVREQPSTDAVLSGNGAQAVNSMILLEPNGSDTPPTPTPSPTATEIGAPTATNTPVPPTPTNTPTNTATPTNTPDPRPLVVSFTLVDADTDQDIATLTDGYVINLAELSSSNVNIRANTNPERTGSVRFAYNGVNNYQTESWPPYTLEGDYSGDYYAWTPEVGDHTLSGTAYTQSGGSGVAGPSHTVNFSVIDPRISGTCSVDYNITWDNSNRFGVDVRLYNDTGATWNGWTVAWNFNARQNIQRSVDLWNGTFVQDGQHIEVTNVSYNGTVNNGDSVTFGFNGRSNPTDENLVPAHFTVNGMDCEIAVASVWDGGEAVASLPMPGVGAASLQDPSLAGLSLPNSVAPVATLAASTMNRVAFETTSLVASPLSSSGLTVPSLSAPFVGNTLAAQPAAMAAAADLAAKSFAPVAQATLPSVLPQTCNLYPIALSDDTVDGVAVGTSLGDIWNGVQPGNFGWLTWVGSPNVPTLVTSLLPPGDSFTYVNPNDATDSIISIGDWVQGSPGVANASEVRAALDILMTMDIIVPVWDQASGTGNNSLYRVVNFARVRITDYHLPNQNRITAIFLGYEPNCGGVNPTPTPTLTPTETPQPTATPTTGVPQPTPTPSAGSCSLDDVAANMNSYSLIVLDDLSTNSDVENRAFIGGNIISSASANFGINVSGVAASYPMLSVVGDIVGGNAIQLNAGSLLLGGSSNGRVINFNGGGSLVQDNALSDGPITNLLQDASAQLAALTANNTAELPSGQPGPARFRVTSVNERGAAIFEVDGNQLFNGSAQQIDLNAGSASMVIINVTGSSINWTSGNMVGNFNNPNWRSRVIWNFPGASSLNFNSYNMMGAVLAPYAHVTTSANIDGSVAVRALTTTSEIHQPTVTANLGALCDEDPDGPRVEGNCKLVWLDWDGGLSSNGELEENILDPSQSGVRRVGDTIAAGPEVQNVRQITDALEQWLNKPMNIVLYDDGDQQNGYQVCGFAELTMTEFEFDSLPKWLAGEFNVNLVRGVIDENAPDYGLRSVYFDD